jgi:hypothetical protein
MSWVGSVLGLVSWWWGNREWEREREREREKKRERERERGTWLTMREAALCSWEATKAAPTARSAAIPIVELLPLKAAWTIWISMARTSIESKACFLASFNLIRVRVRVRVRNPSLNDGLIRVRVMRVRNLAPTLTLHQHYLLKQEWRFCSALISAPTLLIASRPLLIASSTS